MTPGQGSGQTTLPKTLVETEHVHMWVCPSQTAHSLHHFTILHSLLTHINTQPLLHFSTMRSCTHTCTHMRTIMHLPSTFRTIPGIEKPHTCTHMHTSTVSDIHKSLSHKRDGGGGESRERPPAPVRTTGHIHKQWSENRQL